MYKDILFPVDVSEEGSWDESLPVVIEYAQAFGATVHVLTVIPDGSMSVVQQFFPSGSVEKVVERTRSALNDFVKGNFPDDIEVRTVVGKGGAVYESIIKTADKLDVGLIVMSAHRPELKDYLLGPNAAKVVRHSNISVLVVRD